MTEPEVILQVKNLYLYQGYELLETLYVYTAVKGKEQKVEAGPGGASLLSRFLLYISKLESFVHALNHAALKYLFRFCFFFDYHVAMTLKL